MSLMPPVYRSPSGRNRLRGQLRAARLLWDNLGPATAWATAERRLLPCGGALGGRGRG